MRTVKIKNLDEMEDFYVSDWKDTDELLGNIDDALQEHGLELVLGDNQDDSYYVKIEERKKRVS